MVDRESTPPPATATPRPRDRLIWVFWGAQGLRAGWKALLFIVIMVAFYLASQPPLDRIAPHPADGSKSLHVELIRRCVYTLLVLAAVWIMARLERRPLRAYGYAIAGGPMRLVSGAGWGFVSMSVLVGMLWLHGSLVFDGVSQGGPGAYRYAAGTFVVCLMVGLMEESQLRGYLQFTLARTLGFWWAALILSVAFGLLHAHKSGETLVALLSIGASGLLFCLSLWYTKSLYWAVGFHAAWDWAQEYFYGNSGDNLPMHLLGTHPAGDPAWSGGSAGPEGSNMLLPVLLVLLVGMCLWWGRGKPAFGLRERWSW